MTCLRSSRRTLEPSKTKYPQGKHPNNWMPYKIIPWYGIGAHKSAISPFYARRICMIAWTRGRHPWRLFCSASCSRLFLKRPAKSNRMMYRAHEKPQGNHLFSRKSLSHPDSRKVEKLTFAGELFMTTLKTPTVAIFVLVFSAAVLVQDGRKVRKKS